MPKIPQRLIAPGNPAEYVAAPSFFRYVAVQRLLGTMEMVLLRDTVGRTAPAKVYPACEDAGNWFVEPPTAYTSDIIKFKTFTGHAALLKALVYAHQTYGNALYLSR